MPKKIVFIGAGSQFGAKSIVDLLSFPELHDSHLVLVDVNPRHLEPVHQYAKKQIELNDAPMRLEAVADWRDGVLDGADFVITSFAQGGPAYDGVPYRHEIAIPQKYGIHQNVADTAGFGGIFRLLRTGGELLAIAKDMEARCPGAHLLNYVNPMSMLTRTLTLSCPRVHVVGLCHNIQYSIRELAEAIGLDSHRALRYLAAGINHMTWFLRLEHLDGRDAYPDLLRAVKEGCPLSRKFPVQSRLLEAFGHWTTESNRHCGEYLPYFMPREADRAAVGLDIRKLPNEKPSDAARWSGDSDLTQQLDGRKPYGRARSFEYGIHIIHAMSSDAVYRMNLNVMNNGHIDNLAAEHCVEVPCTVDRLGIHPHHVGALPSHLAALCRGMADSQTLASDAFLERDMHKAYLACAIDPCTAASATPAKIKQCFDELLEAERPWLQWA